MNGFAYKFEVYSAKENNNAYKLASEADLEGSANVVVRLAKIIPKNCNYRLYFGKKRCS